MFKKILLLFVCILIAPIFWATIRLNAPIGNTTNGLLSITVNKNDGMNTIASQLSALSQKNGGSLSAIEIQVLSFITGQRNTIRTGDYEFSVTTHLSQILNKLKNGEITAPKIRIPEGVTWRDIKGILAKAELQHDAQDLDVMQVASALNINASSIEGMIFPDTYQYRKNETETSFLQRAHQTLLQKLNTAWEKRASNLPYATPYEALIMASIVEKETGIASDRPMVAAVFINRLKTRMRLQTDPTIIYGMGENFQGNITKADLRRDTPFNTYTRHGLTPTPIGTASLASINAALNPANINALYFVARGDGSSEFSQTLSEHNAAVRKYQLGQ